MTLLVLAQPRQSAPGILLNPVLPRRYSYAAPNSAANNSDSTASSASSTSDGSSNRGELDYNLSAQSASHGRRIRFAPLPDPRKLDAVDNDSVTSLSEGGASETTGNSSTAASLTPPPIDISLVTGAEISRSSLYKKAASMWSSNSLLKPLLIRQSPPNADDGSPYHSLFRVSSLESAMSAFSFRRRDKSPDSTGSTPSLMTFGGPVSSSSSLPITSRRSATPRPKTSPNSNTLPRRGRFTRPLTMLNGRVYGRHRGALTPDPFQHQRPAGDDEFVEWGFGGLGSVPHSRATGAAADWSRVRGGTGFTSVPDEDDDGSGMRWVKRRRERKAREAAEEAAEKAAIAPHASDDTEKNGPPQPIVEGGENVQDDHREKQLVASDDTPSSVLPPIPGRIEATSSPPPSSMVPSHDDPPVPRRLSSEHHDTAVAILPPLHQHHPHHHRPNPSRPASLDSSFQRPASNLLPRKPSIEKASDTQSSTSDEPEDERENTEDEDDEDDSDEETMELARKTAECAGVEKISRHRDIHTD